MRYFLLIAILLCLAGPLSAQNGGEGYYKDIFMDSGIRLTSKSDLPVARYLDLKMERFISAVTKELTAVDTGMSGTYTGITLDKDSPLLKYNDFGGDRYVGRTEVLNGIPYTIRTEIE